MCFFLFRPKTIIFFTKKRTNKLRTAQTWRCLSVEWEHNWVNDRRASRETSTFFVWGYWKVSSRDSLVCLKISDVKRFDYKCIRILCQQFFPTVPKKFVESNTWCLWKLLRRCLFLYAFKYLAREKIEHSMWFKRKETKWIKSRFYWSKSIA